MMLNNNTTAASVLNGGSGCSGANGHSSIADGSWNLRIFVTDLKIEHNIRVKGDLHVGGVMLKLVEDLGIKVDWSDHALWWPLKNLWLCHTKSTLDQCGVSAENLLHFTPMHKHVRIQLPDLRYLDTRVNFSTKTFSAIIQLCKELGIRHPEELSFAKPLQSVHLKHNYNDLPKKKLQQNGQIKNSSSSSCSSSNGGSCSGSGYKNRSRDKNGSASYRNGSLSPDGGSVCSLDRSNSFLCSPINSHNKSSQSIGSNSHHHHHYHNHHNHHHHLHHHNHHQHHSLFGTWKNSNGCVYDANGRYSPNISTSYEQLNGNFDSSLAHSPESLNAEARIHLLRPKNLIEKARMNFAWLDSSLSIMEQGIKEFDTLCLRFKFYAFFDLNPKYDAVRINQIFEQAKWQLLNEEIDCTEEEMLMFAALQLQVSLQATLPQPNHLNGGNSYLREDDEIDAALTDLQVSLEGSASYANRSMDITEVPELFDNLRFLKPKRFTLKAFKRYWFTCRDLNLMLYKNKGDAEASRQPNYLINLRGCEVQPDVNLAHQKFGIKLEVPGSDGMIEMLIRCDTEQQYTKWMAACRLGAKGKSLADASYDAEIQNIAAFLHLQKPSSEPALNPASLDIDPEDFLAPRFVKKSKSKLVQRILEAHANVKDLTLTESKLNYIKAWQSLPEYGISLFVVRFSGAKKDELLGVAHNRILKMDIQNGDHLKTWRFNSMKSWNVNWDVKHMTVEFEEGNIVFSCSSADCKVIHEFIGGYIFLSMRSKDSNQTLNEEMFHKLTGGWM